MKKGLLLIAASLAITTSFAQLSNNLVLHLPIDGNTNDIIGSKTMSNSGATLTLDRFGSSNNALSFDGVDDKLSSSIDNLDLDSFAYSVWVKFDDHPANGAVSFILNVGGTVRDAGINLANNYSGYTGFSGFSYVSTGTSINYTTGTLPSKGSWHHVVLSRYTDKVQVYVDGNLAGTSAASGPASYSGSNLGISIGSRLGNSNYFKGIIDDIRIYNRPITSTEVSQLYSITNTVSPVANAFNLDVFPNPSVGKVLLTSDQEILSSQVEVYNVSGQLLDKSKIIRKEGQTVEFIFETKGIYFLKVNIGGQLITKKILIN